jgi:hypothetical protein
VLLVGLEVNTEKTKSCLTIKMQAAVSIYWLLINHLKVW